MSAARSLYPCPSLLGLTIAPAFTAAILLAPAPARAQTFAGLGFFSGGTASEPVALSADGSVIVGFANKGSLGDRAFRWTSAAGMVNLGLFAGAAYSRATRCSGDGSVVVGYGGTGDVNDRAAFRRAFRWSAATGMVNLGAFPGGTQSVALGASGDGSVVVGWSDVADGSEHGFRWTAAGGMVDLGPVTGAGVGAWYNASGVSADDSIIVGNSTAFGAARATLWSSALGLVNLGALPGGAWSYASAVSRDGSIVVGTSDSSGGQRGFRWSAAAGMVELPPGPEGPFLSAESVSDDGRVIVGFGGAGGNGMVGIGHPYLWTSTRGTQDLGAYLPFLGVDTTNWFLSFATGVSADGRTIIGFGNHAGRQEGWRATIPAQCAADFDGSGALNAQDIFAFINAWFAQDPRGDVDGISGLDVRDIFAFVGAWFAGCG